MASNWSQLNTFEQAQYVAEDQGLSLGSILDEVNGYANTMRPPPNIPMPTVQNSNDGDSVAESELVDESFSEETEEDLGRKERRRMFLSTLRNLVPELQHSLPVQASASGHFSLLQEKDKRDRMPLLFWANSL